MIKFVPYLSKEAIEGDATALLAEYAHARGIIVAPPIPIEDIVEKHLKLRFEFDDMHRLFGIPRDPGRGPDILAAIFFDEGRIVIDESLDPDERRGVEGRYRFTLGHEAGGHWRLHRGIFGKNPAQGALFREQEARPSLVCRPREAKRREETQADLYASCLLMPRNLVIEAWRERFGHTKARIFRRQNRVLMPDYVGDDIAAALQSFELQSDETLINEFARPFAEKFLVSLAAMRIRLEELDLLRREVPPRRTVAVGI